MFLDKGKCMDYNVKHRKGKKIAYNITPFAYVVKG